MGGGRESPGVHAVGHLYVHADDLPWWWADPSNTGTVDVAGCRPASTRCGDYPVAIDSDHAVWRAFGNEYWPALYLVDARGHVRHHHLGEGEYERPERFIQRLLSEAGHAVGRELVSADAHGLEAAADWENLRSPDMYLGAGRAEHFASPGGAAPDKRRAYSVPTRLSLNSWALAGDGRWGSTRSYWTRPVPGSRATSTPAIFIGSWDRRRPAGTCDHGCS